MDYAFLRQEGIRLLERLAGAQWTDFNAHDPGITILEQLCYALTDLAYRTGYEIKDLLADGGAGLYDALYSPAEVLSTSPVTPADLRKVLLDLEGVRNAWVEPVERAESALYYDASDQGLYLGSAPHRAPVALRGVYRVLIDADGSVPKPQLILAVEERLRACRSLGDVFEPPQILDPLPIMISARVEVGPADDPDRLLAQIYHALAHAITPRARFYSLAELLARGKGIDEIMDGPPLSRGFIDDDELASLDRRRGLRASDLIQVVLDVAGVVAVNGVKLSSSGSSDFWYLDLGQAVDRGAAPVLNLDSDIKLVHGERSLATNPAQVRQIFDQLQRADIAPPLPADQRDLKLPPGRDRHVGRYYSIQHQLPALYGIGELGLPDSAPPQRQAQARQLKAYLLFFDQILANAFAQLAGLRALFAFSPEARTYFAQEVDDPGLGLDELWHNGAKQRAENLYGKDETSDLGRKNRFLDHLLARFGEEFAPAALDKTLIGAKSAFLADYRELGAARGSALRATRPPYSWPRSALERRIGHKLHIEADPEGSAGPPPAPPFYMVEPILLRPQPEDWSQWTRTAESVGWQSPILLTLPQAAKRPPRRDPFSQRLCFVFSNATPSLDPALVPQVVREESPAHLDVQIQWLDPGEMITFGAAYDEWLASCAASVANPSDRAANVRARAARDRLIDLLRIGNPLPLRNLDLRYQQRIAHGATAKISISGAQFGVCYQLCDADGSPILRDNKPVEALRPDDQTSPELTLETTPITQDQTFSILAIRKSGAYGTELETLLETYLQSNVALKVGIKADLALQLVAGVGQTASAQQITVGYGATISVNVMQTQDGVTYVLVNEAAPEVALSKPLQGDRGKIKLIARDDQPLREDATLRVKAYRGGDEQLLKQRLKILVRPDPAVEVGVDLDGLPTVAYGGGTRIVLSGAQESAEYRLYQRRLRPGDYVLKEDQPSQIGALLETPRSFIQLPAQITDWDHLDGFMPLDTPGEQQGGELSFKTGDLHEDTIFIVRATKKDNRETLQLIHPAVVLVRPSPEPAISVVQSPIRSGAEGMLTLSGTQQGVEYQLLRESEREGKIELVEVNPPGYDYRDRGVERARIELDFVVEASDDEPILLLPTGPVGETSTYRVRATKILTGVSAELTGTAKIEVEGV
jgi:hypothetical protein